MKYIILSLVVLAMPAFGQVSPSSSPNSPGNTVPAYDGKKILSLAEAELGTYKLPGEDDMRVKQYAVDTFQNDEVYTADGWCSAFLAFILKEAGYQYSPNNTDFGWMFVAHRVSQPTPGDIAMLDGHIAFYIGKKVNAEGSHVVGLIGGNQDYQVCVMWVPESDIEYYAQAEVAGADWKPEKHIPNGETSGHLNVLDDHKRIPGTFSNPTSSGKSQHPL